LSVDNLATVSAIRLDLTPHLNPRTTGCSSVRWRVIYIIWCPKCCASSALFQKKKSQTFNTSAAVLPLTTTTLN